MPKAKFNDIVNNPGLRHIAIKIFSYLDYVDYSSRYDDDSSFDSLDFEDYDPYASYGDLQTCRLVCKAWRQVLETSRLYWIKRLFYENEEFDDGKNCILPQIRRNTTYKQAFESAKKSNKWQWQDIKGLVLTLENYVEGTYEGKNLPGRDYRTIDPLHYFVQKYKDYRIEDLEHIKIIIKFMTQLDIKNSVDKVSAFFKACEINDAEDVVKVFLRASRSGDKLINFNYRDKKTGKTGFIRACELGNNQIVNVLIKASKNDEVDFNAKDDKGYTGLIWACWNGHSDVVQTIFENANEMNINVNAKSKEGLTAFRWALYQNHYDVKAEIYDTFINFHGKVDIEFNTSVGTNQRNTLWSVCQHCTKYTGQVLGFLLDHSEEFQFNVNQTFENGRNVMHVACAKGNVEAVKTLLFYAEEKSLEIKKLDFHGKNILMVASGGYPQDNAQATVVCLLLSMIDELELDVNAVDIKGRSGFMIACSNANTSLGVIQSYLLHAKSKNINLNLQDLEGNSGLMLAAKNILTSKVFEILLKNSKKIGIDLNLQNNNGETVFTSACIGFDFEDLKYVEPFIQNATKIDIDFNMTDHLGQTGFIKICAKKDPEYEQDQADIVEYLLQHSESIGLDVNKSDDKWMTGFMWACKLKRCRVVEKFIKHSEAKGGIDLDAADIQGRTGYDMWPKYFKKRHLFKF